MVLMVAMAMSGTSKSNAQQAAREVLFVTCPAETGILCQALVQSLASVAPGHVIRLGEPPATVEITHVTLYLELRAGDLWGHLGWTIPNGVSGLGTAHRHTGDDVTTSPEAARKFTAEIVAKSPELHGMLTAKK